MFCWCGFCGGLCTYLPWIILGNIPILGWLIARFAWRRHGHKHDSSDTDNVD